MLSSNNTKHSKNTGTEPKVTTLFAVQIYGEKAVLILARGGSKGVRFKNLQTVGDTTLLSRAIQTAKAAGLHDVTVSTDNPLIALEGIKSGANVFHRSFITATDWAPSIWGSAEFLERKPQVEILILLQATSPFLLPKHLSGALQKIGSPIPYDCVFSVTRSHKLRWKSLNQRVFPINFNISARPRRQDWSGEFLESGAFYIARRSVVMNGSFQNIKQVNTMSNPEVITFEDLEATDVISVELVPERKGLILKHCEYYVSSRRHGTTVTRRYNDFVQLYDVLYAKYPYRAVCRLPPKRVVVNGGSPLFLQRRRAALQRWLTLMARHPVLAHDADLRTFLCETISRLEKPKHDEFTLAGTQEGSASEMITEDLQTSFETSKEQLRLVQLGLDRLFQIFERAEGRCEAEKADIRELGAGLNALSATNVADTARWSPVREALKVAAELAVDMGESTTEEMDFTEDGIGGRLLLALDALSAYRELCSRLSRGLHAERAAAAGAGSGARGGGGAGAGGGAAARLLRARHRYALLAAAQEGVLSRTYAVAAVESLPSLFRTQGSTHARVATLWADLYAALRHAAKPK